MLRSIVVICALALPMSSAVVNTNSETKIERREAPFETYGPPPVQPQHTIVLPTPVYGPPAAAQYPTPPPDRVPAPPAPPKEYGKFLIILNLTRIRSV